MSVGEARLDQHGQVLLESGDGLLVSAPHWGCAPGRTCPGRVVSVDGAVELRGAQTDGALGDALAVLPDGRVAVGAPGRRWDVEPGQVQVWSLGEPAPDVVLHAPAGQSLGRQVVGWGDRLVVGLPLANAASVVPLIGLEGEHALADVGDRVDGPPGDYGCALAVVDGVLAVGAGDHDGNTKDGLVHLFNTPELLSPSATLVGINGEKAGSSLAAGDPDGDGVMELAVSAPDGERVYVVDEVASLSGTHRLVDAGAVIRAPLPGAYFGFDTDWGDVDQDGYDDLLVGQFGARRGEDFGAAWLYLGPLGTDPEPDRAYLGDLGPSEFGRSVSVSAGQVAVGAPAASVDAIDQGAVFLFEF